MTIQTDVLFPALTGLAGVIIGSIGSVFRDLWQSRAEHRRERMRLAVQLAVEQHRMWMEVGKTRPIQTPPLLITLLLQADLLADLASDREVTPERLARLHARSSELHRTLQTLSETDPD